jgi:hypothetical protein
MKTMNNVIASRKFVWPAVIVLAAIYFGPSVFRSLIPITLRLTGQQRSGKGNQNAGTVAVPGQSAPPAGQVSPVADDPALAKFIGTWQGNATLPGRKENCMLKLEVRQSHEKASEFSGYSSLSCAPSLFEMLGQAGDKSKANAATVMDNASKAMNPVSAIMTGNPANGSIQFRVDKNIGVDEVSNGCPLVSLSATNFGSDQIEVDLKESQRGACQGGQMLMHRLGK